MKKPIILIMVFVLLSSFASASTFSDLQDYLNYITCEDDVTTDITGNYNGTTVGTVTLSDKAIWGDKTCQFDGASYTNITNLRYTQFDVKKNGSVACWVYHNTSTTHQMILSKYDIGECRSLQFGIEDNKYGGNRAEVCGSGIQMLGNINPSTTADVSYIYVHHIGIYAAIWINNTLSINSTGAAAHANGTVDYAFGWDSAGNTYWNGTIECAIWDRVLTPTERVWLADKTNDLTSIAGQPATPSFVAPTPADNAYNNTNQTINISHSGGTEVRYYLNVSLTGGNSDMPYLFNVTQAGTNYRNFSTNFSDGVYLYEAYVQNITNGKFSNVISRTLTIDTVNPTITLNANNNFSSDNSTIISNYLRNLSINITFFDTNLYQTLINITNESGVSVYSKLNTSITGTTVNISEVIDIANLSIGNYTIKLIATDTHTAKSIENYGVIKGLNYLRYTTPEGNIIKITSNTFPLTFSTTKFKDRYDFRFNYLFSKETYKFRIESYSKIDYIDSDYAAHFVIISKNGRGNWIDFNPISKKDIKVIKIDDYIYEIEVTSNGLKSFTFSSLGGLNTIEKHYLLRIGAVLDIWSYNDNSRQPINATMTIGSQVAHTISNTSAARLVNITKETTQVTLNSTGYGTEIHTISVTSKYQNFSLNMTPVSATKLYFYDERSEALITGETFSVYLETTGFSQTYSSITTNPYTITNLDSGLYKLKASSTNYPERQYLNLNISNVTTTNLNIYLINSTDGAEKTFNIVGEALNPLEDVFVVFSRIIGGTRTTIAEEESDFAGKVKLYLDSNYKYTINFSKTDYEGKTINLEPTDSEYVITMISTIGAYNQSVYEGLRYRFEPSNIILNNNTKYNFTFTLNSTVWEITNCNLTLKNESDILSTTTSYTSTGCFLRIEQDTLSMTTITSEAIYELNNQDFTVSQQYSIIYTYEGEFSLKNFLDDLTDFSMAGFDSFGRMILAFVVIFVILAMASMKISFEHKEVPLFIFWALVGFFSYVNWFYLDLGTMPDLLGLKKWFIFYLISLVCGGFMINKVRK